MFASWFEPSTLITEPNVTGMPYAARKTMITIDLRGVAAHLREAAPTSRTRRGRGGSRRPRIAFAHIFLTHAQKIRSRSASEEDRAGDDPERQHGWFEIASLSLPNWKSNDPATALNR